MDESPLTIFQAENQDKIWIKLTSKNSSRLSLSDHSLLEIELNKKGTLLKKKWICSLSDDYLLFFKDKSAKQPQALIFIEFELRIEWIYNIIKQKDGTKIDKIIGFKLLKANTKSVEFCFLQTLDDTHPIQLFFASKINTYGFHDIYKATKKIGKGSFASVYLVQKKNSLEEFAVKAFSKESLYSQDHGKESLVNELKIMRILSHHQNIIKLFEVCETDNSIYMVVELLKGGSLLERIKEKKIFEEKDIIPILKGMLKGIEHIHSKGVMHRDIKPENILFRTNNNTEADVCIADFGLSTQTKEKKYLFFRCGTPGYVAPEVINLKDDKAKYSEVCDLFSVGVIFHILILGKPPFNGRNYNDIIQENKLCNIDFNDGKYARISKQAKSLLVQLLEKDPKQRITAKLALTHPFFDLNELSTSSNDDSAKGESIDLNSKLFDSSYIKPMFTINTTINTDSIKSPILEKRTTIEGFFKIDDSNSSHLVTKETVFNGLVKTVETFQECTSQNEMDLKKNKNLLIKIYKNPILETQSPSLKRDLEEARKNRENINEKEQQAKILSPLNSIKENVEEEEKKIDN